MLIHSGTNYNLVTFKMQKVKKVSSTKLYSNELTSFTGFVNWMHPPDVIMVICVGYRSVLQI